MSSGAVVIAASLGATAFFSLSTALKHRSATHAMGGGRDRSGGTAQFLKATAVHPPWLGGLLADAGGLALQITALHLGALAVVQPLMVTALLFSIVLNHWFAGTRITRNELGWAGLLVAALGGFLLLSGASSPAVTGPLQQADRAPAIAIAAGAVGFALVSLLAARRAHRRAGALWLGITVGLDYACTAALIKSSSNTLLAHGPLGMLTSWQPYAALVTGGLGLVLTQLAFRAGPLSTSLPAMATADPLLSIALGVFVYDEHLRPGAVAIGGELTCLALLCLAAFALSRVRAEDPNDPAPASPSRPHEGVSQ